ncbi:hypothetical protein K7W03_23485 [Sphingobium sp. PNB]|uniref:hypothetical protein n=1 Tax=Sphingobium sp. PNB TaxID=863934 RepID=UPI001CA3F94F|nr:hypothetical protein [Sphingobium sp. PNB]MCB4862558.1 hypothetical protein [Sphingobium sp. PNB]
MESSFHEQRHPITVALTSIQRSRKYSAYRSQRELEADAALIYEVQRTIGRFLFPIGRPALIDYRDFGGIPTRRRISVKFAFSYNKAVYLESHCHLRGADRSFKLNNIEWVGADFPHIVDKLDDYHTSLAACDFFIHPKKWGQYRKAALFLRQQALQSGASDKQAFEAVARFIFDCQQRGRWNEWATPQQAIGGALLAGSFDLPNWSRSDIDTMTGKASKMALMNALDALG